MKVDALAIALRPRPMYEAADLGVQLARASARSAWGCFAPLWAAVGLLALATAPLAPWAPWLLVALAKPWLDRTLLFVFSRAAFGEPTDWDALWAAKRAVWGGQLWRTLTLCRLSPWRSYLLPAVQLEGQRGAEGRKRRLQLLRGHRGAAMWMQFAFGMTEMLLLLAMFALVVWMSPGQESFWIFRWLQSDNSLAATLGGGASYLLAVLLLEPFYVAAGFAMYLNRRVELEAWDIEWELKHAFA